MNIRIIIDITMLCDLYYTHLRYGGNHSNTPLPWQHWDKTAMGVLGSYCSYILTLPYIEGVKIIYYIILCKRYIGHNLGVKDNTLKVFMD